MGEALLFGLVASVALPLGAFIGAHVQIPKRVLASMLAFAAGALMTALAFELFEDSYEHGGLWRSALGLIAGALVFTVISAWLDRVAEGNAGDEDGSEKLDTDAPASDSSPSSASVSGARASRSWRR
jgi:ZIP family zinc transporter